MAIWDTIIGSAVDIGTSIYNNEQQKKENQKARDFAAQQQEDAQSFNRAMQEDAQAFNSAEAQINRDFQSEEAALVRDFNASEAQKNRDFQSAEAEAAYDRQVEFYEKYQSIGSQVQQYKDAGLNPALLAGGVSVGSTPSSSAASGSAASASSPSGSSASSGSTSSSALGASFSSLPGILSIAERMLSVEEMKATIENLKKQGSKTDAETQNIIESTNLTAQQVLSERERTSEVKALASEIGNRDRIQVERWNQESVKISEEIEAIKASKELDVAKKEEAIAQKLYNEARASYEQWKTETASLRYWTSTGAYALSASLRNLADIGLSVARITDIFKGKMQKGLKLPSDDIQVPDGTGYVPPKRNSRADDFIEDMVGIFDGLDLDN